MTQSWRALPVADTGISLKAPSFREHQKQLSPKFSLPQAIGEEVMVGLAMVQGVDAASLRVPQGQQYRLWRYPQGLAVRTPSGWVMYQPSEAQVLHPTTQMKVEGEERSFRET